jgi:hypothetical protein
MNMANIAAPQFFGRMGVNNSSSVSNNPSARSPSINSLPPSDANAIAYMRTQHHPATPQNSTNLNAPTPASTQGRRSVDGQTTAGNSPSQLFGGVDQLLREGQDWIYRDQTQLANDFENWNNQSMEDIASWFANTANRTSPGSGYQPSTHPVLSTEVNGGPVGGNAFPNGTPAQNANLNGAAAGFNGLGMQGFTYDEGSWYDYQ